MAEVRQLLSGSEQGYTRVPVGQFVAWIKPDRGFGKFTPDIRLPGIEIEVPGTRQQVLRIDAFEKVSEALDGGPGAHFHVWPVDPNGGQNLYYPVMSAEHPLEAACRHFFVAGNIRNLLFYAGFAEIAEAVDQRDLNDAAKQLRGIYAEARRAAKL